MTQMNNHEIVEWFNRTYNARIDANSQIRRVVRLDHTIYGDNSDPQIHSGPVQHEQLQCVSVSLPAEDLGRIISRMWIYEGREDNPAIQDALNQLRTIVALLDRSNHA